MYCQAKTKNTHLYYYRYKRDWYKSIINNIYQCYTQSFSYEVIYIWKLHQTRKVHNTPNFSIGFRLGYYEFYVSLKCYLNVTFCPLY